MFLFAGVCWFFYWIGNIRLFCFFPGKRLGKFISTELSILKWSRMAEGHQGLSKVLGRPRGIYLPRHRQKYQLEAESLLESSADSSVSDIRICTKPRRCGRFPIIYLPFPQSESNSLSICSGSRISTTSTYAVTSGLISIPGSRFHNTLLSKPCEPYRSSERLCLKKGKSIW